MALRLAWFQTPSSPLKKVVGEGGVAGHGIAFLKAKVKKPSMGEVVAPLGKPLRCPLPTAPLAPKATVSDM